MNVRVEGLKELNANLMQLKSSTARGVLRRTALASLEPMAEEARRLAPDDPKTGAPDLKSSIAVSTKASRERPSRDKVVAYMGPTRDGYPQAIMQEFGTVNHQPQPYMRPAWDGGKDQLLDDVKANLGAEIDKTVKRLAKRAAK